MVERVYKLLKHTLEHVVLRQVRPSQLGALALRVTNATCQLEREPSALGVGALFGKLYCEI